MKTITQIMLPCFLIMAFIFSQSPLNAQTTKTDTIPVMKYTVIQAGTAQLVNGEVTIKFTSPNVNITNDKTGMNYFVSLTPIGNCGQLTIFDKEKDGFTIQSLSPNGAINKNIQYCSFDYTVVIKQVVH